MWNHETRNNYVCLASEHQCHLYPWCVNVSIYKTITTYLDYPIFVNFSIITGNLYIAYMLMCVYMEDILRLNLWRASVFTLIQIHMNGCKHNWCSWSLQYHSFIQRSSLCPLHIYQVLHISLNFACGCQPQGWWVSFLKASIFHILVRSLINTVSMGSVCVEQMAQASLGEMKNANL